MQDGVFFKNIFVSYFIFVGEKTLVTDVCFSALHLINSKSIPDKVEIKLYLKSMRFESPIKCQST